MSLDFTIRIHLRTLLEKLFMMFFGLIGMENNGVIIWKTSSYFLNTFIDQQSNLEMLFQV